MKQFTLTLDKNYQRPIIELKEWNNFEALLDTGALFPIWTGSEKALKKVGGESLNKRVEFGGFGGKAHGILYRLKCITIGDLIFPEMPIIACSDLEDVPFQLILSATMFCNLLYEVDDKNHRLNITVPDDESVVRNLVIEDKNDRLHVLCNTEARC